MLLLLQAGPAPDNAWDGWWPATQWTRESKAPNVDAIRSARRAWQRIDYPSMETPWGNAGVSMQWAGKVDSPPTGIRLDLLLSAPEDALKKGTLKAPKKGEVDAALVTPAGKGVAQPLEAPDMMGWFGHMGMLSGDFMIEFGWLPQGVEDYWIRLKVKDWTAWILLPYGVGEDPSLPLKELKGPGGSPARPAEAGPKDTLLVWKSVRYDLGWMDDKGKVDPVVPAGLDRKERDKWINARTHLTASLSNPFDGAVELELYRGTFERFNLNRPRSTVAIGVPGSRVFFGAMESIRRDEVLRRYDKFKMWRQPADDRCWGLLRVTLEESVFEIAVPGSLFLYVQGRLAEK